MKKICVLAAAVLVLGGCASLNESECLTADWHLIGYEDGARGEPVSRIGEHRRACAEYGVTPDYEAYRDGHTEGLAEYCTFERGFALGKHGGAYNGVCPPALAADFLDGYELGKVHYGYLSEISQYSADISRSKSRIKKLKKKLADKEAELVSDDTTKEKRVELLAQIKEHQREVGELEANILEYEKLRAVVEAEYSQLEQPLH